MDWEEIEAIENDRERTIAIYQNKDEDKRLKQKNCSWVEYLTIRHYLDKYFQAGTKILDVGAGTGVHSFDLAERGCDVAAIDLSPENVNKIRLDPRGGKIKCSEGDAVDLSLFEDNSFDGVLLMGPLYHLMNIIDREKAINEALRVLKSHGVLVMTFMNNDVVPYLLMKNDSEFFSGQKYDHETFHIKNNLYVFHTIEEIRKLVVKENLVTKKEIAVDGLSLIMHNEINVMNQENFELYMKYHLYMCEKKEYLAASSHICLILKNISKDN